MNKRNFLGLLLVLPIVARGAVVAMTRVQPEQKQQAAADGYVCPVTGETLACPNCCPLTK